jgi:hypothetical protein
LKTDIEMVYDPEAIREQPVLLSLCKLLSMAERILDGKEKGWAFLKINSGLDVV